MRVTESQRSTTPSALLICGSINQTTQMVAVARALPEVSSSFTPYYGGRLVERARRMGLLENTIGGNKLRGRCLEHLRDEGLSVDDGGGARQYDLVVTCSDLVVPPNVRFRPLVAVQEGILDTEGLVFHAVHRLPFLPRWLAGTAATGLSGAYDRLCVASAGYRDHFVSRGAPADRVVVTGIPNFDDCERYRVNSFPHHGYVLVCTSDVRETFRRDDRRAFIRRALDVARGRPVIFKLHPNENAARATREILELAPSGLVFSRGSAEEMIANCDAMVAQYSSTVFVALALGKEVHSFHDPAELRRLMPEQNGAAARNIAEVCRSVLAEYGFCGDDAPANSPRQKPSAWESAA